MIKFISNCSASILSIMAKKFASSTCFGRMYEPKLPKELQENDKI